jgi:NAD-dependent deacetylase
VKQLKLVVLTGAGISAESGLKTFRDAGGLWEGHRVEDVATPEAWHRNPGQVLEFYNLRREAARLASPNQAHQILAALEKDFDVQIITQNVDDLHERAGSTQIIHLHGSLFEARSSQFPNLVYPWKNDKLDIGDLCERGTQLRPNIVWFGEDVPLMYEATQYVMSADFFLIVGTSLQVYPAAGLINYLASDTPILLVDPGAPYIANKNRLINFQEAASTGMVKVRDYLLTFRSEKSKPDA